MKHFKTLITSILLLAVLSGCSSTHYIIDKNENISYLGDIYPGELVQIETLDNIKHNLLVKSVNAKLIIGKTIEMSLEQINAENYDTPLEKMKGKNIEIPLKQIKIMKKEYTSPLKTVGAVIGVYGLMGIIAISYWLSVL